MKSIIGILLFILLSSQLLLSQNWQPITSGTVYNYQIDTAEIITNTIKIDSVNSIDNDSVFYLNRIFTPCDTCENSNYALKNQPQFLMRQMRKKSDSLFIFQDTSEFIIMPLQKTGQSWIYDIEKNITATILNEQSTVIFGINDSVKNINLSNGKNIIISKNFGIIQFPAVTENYFQLIGVEGNKQFGIKMPNFWDFLNYEVGDILQRQNYSESWGTKDYDGYFNIKKYTIKTKQIINDTVKYGIEGWNETVTVGDIGNSYTISSRFTDTIIYVDSVSHFTNKLNAETVDIIGFLYPDWNMSLYAKINFSQSNSLCEKSCGSEDMNIRTLFQVSEIHPDLLHNTEFFGPDQLIYKYVEGMGLYYKMMWFESAGGDFFMGKIHNGITTGVVYSDAYFEHHSDIMKIDNQQIKIFPNPASIGQKIYIKTKSEIETYVLYNITGQQVLSGNYNPNGILLKNLNSGIFILELKAKTGILREKLVLK